MSLIFGILCSVRGPMENYHVAVYNNVEIHTATQQVTWKTDVAGMAWNDHAMW
jgi:hypothetical protein